MSSQSEKTSQILKKVRQIEIRSRRMATDAFGGMYKSIFKGQGIDFQEIRQYTPGDDIRAIDWNVTAKTGTPFVKIFKEERELTFLLVVDLSASLNFGSGNITKRELTAEIASLLAYSAILNNDNAGLLLFSDHIEKFIFPNKGKEHILRLIRDILFFQPKNRGTNFTTALQFILKLLKRRSVIFFISDFLDNPLPNEQADFLKQLDIVNQKHDLICISIRDPREYELPPVGYITLQDSESAEKRVINTYNAHHRQQYALQAEKQFNELTRTLRLHGVDHLNCFTNRPYLNTLRTFMYNRAK